MGLITVDDQTVSLESESDIVEARMYARDFAASVGFDLLAQVEVATAVSELARNVIQYAERGEIHLSIVERPGSRGVRILCRDRGPGIAELDKALAGGYSTSGGMARGLSGARRFFDDFTIKSQAGEGTEIVGTRWL